MARRKAQSTVSDQLRQAIQQSDLTIYALAKLTGISSQQISRFAKGERSLTLEVFDKLAATLGLQLAPVADPVAASPVAVVAADQDVDAAVLATVRRQQTRMGPTTLGTVFKALQTKDQALTLGTFHDAVRRLHAAGKVRLTPWTQAMYQLDSPEACLLCGREIMAYAEVR